MLPPWRVAECVEEKHVSSQSLLSWIRCECTNWWLHLVLTSHRWFEAALCFCFCFCRVSTAALLSAGLRRLCCAFKYYLFYRVYELPTWKSIWAPYKVGWWSREHWDSRCNTSWPSSHCFKMVRKKKYCEKREETVGNCIHGALGELRETSKT